MNKIGIVFLLVLFNNAFSQNSHGKECGFDVVMQKLDRKYPDNKKNREQYEDFIANSDKKAMLNKFGANTPTNALYTGQIYEIPVVVHVIESNAAANSNLALTDLEISNWIARANAMYATTYGNGFYAEGSGTTGGSVMPF